MGGIICGAIGPVEESTTVQDASMLLDLLKRGSWPSLIEFSDQSSVPSGCVEMPAWARSLVQLGFWTTLQKSRGSSVRWAVIVPDRRYASLLVALGGFLGRMCLGEKAREAQQGDLVHWVEREKLQRGSVIGRDPKVPHLVQVKGGKAITSLPPENIIVANGKMTLETARNAVWSAQLLSRFGLSATASDLISPARCLAIYGSRTTIEAQSVELGMSLGGKCRAFRDAIFLGSDPRRHSLTRLISAADRHLVADKEECLAVLDGSDAIHFLEHNPNDKRFGLAGVDTSAILLLTEHEFAKSQPEIEKCFEHWGGSWVPRKTTDSILPGATGAIVMGKIR